MIAWIIIAVALGVLAGLATHVCADAADPDRRHLRAEFEAKFEVWKTEYVNEWHWTWKRLEDEKIRLAALERKLRRREDLLRDRENYAATLKEIQQLDTSR
jgi:hypothetical protein